MSVSLSHLKQYEFGKVKEIIECHNNSSQVPSKRGWTIASLMKKYVPHQFLGSFLRNKLHNSPESCDSPVCAIKKKDTPLEQAKNCSVSPKNVTKIRHHVAGCSLRERVFSLGIIPGSVVQMVGETPLGDPFIIDIAGHLVSLRKTEADMIMVERMGV